MMARGATAALLATLSWACLGRRSLGAGAAQTRRRGERRLEGDAADRASGLTIYPPSYFDHLPAQQRQRQDPASCRASPSASGDDVRGFGGAAGNVLIDGERPSSKAVAARHRRCSGIPASRVERIDLIRGGAPASTCRASRWWPTSSASQGPILDHHPAAGQDLMRTASRRSSPASSRATGRPLSSTDGQLSVRKDKNFDTGTGRPDAATESTAARKRQVRHRRPEQHLPGQHRHGVPAGQRRYGSASTCRANARDTLRNEYGFPTTQRTGISHLERTGSSCATTRARSAATISTTLPNSCPTQAIALQTLSATSCAPPTTGGARRRLLRTGPRDPRADRPGW